MKKAVFVFAAVLILLAIVSVLPIEPCRKGYAVTKVGDNVYWCIPQGPTLKR